ncbi:AarF/UbiB family protein [Peribacillus asahii]|uniref:protein kinase domain-containing protein n=1 Tax=Peribacillus asahii TaxID=228899 RepID=UPI00380F646F
MSTNREEEIVNYLKGNFNIENPLSVKAFSYGKLHEHFIGTDSISNKKLFIKVDTYTKGDAAKREAEILQIPSFQSSKFFPKVVHHSTSGNFPFVSFEYITGSVLHTILNNKSLKSKIFNNPDTIQMFIQQLFTILKTLEHNKIIHRDIHPGNFMVTTNQMGQFKHIILIDFSFSVGVNRFPELPFLIKTNKLAGLGLKKYKPDLYKWDNKYAIIKVIDQVYPLWREEFPEIWNEINSFDGVVYIHNNSL